MRHRFGAFEQGKQHKRYSKKLRGHPANADFIGLEYMSAYAAEVKCFAAANTSDP
jgi:hypothetical protein